MTSRWDEIKREARRKCFYRKILHGFGYGYISTIGIKLPELQEMLRNINSNEKNQLKLF